MMYFAKLDHFFSEKIPNRKSLNPKQPLVNSFEEIETNLKSLSLSEAQMKILAFQLERILISVFHHFPENIFWDFDFLIHRLAKNSLVSKDYNVGLNIYTNKLIAIFEIFGAHSPIKFRYIHDFVYGFDWLKWMLEKRTPTETEDPFGLDFLNYIHNRGLELVSLIQKNDTNYPDLEGIYRNPFLFVRSTDEEICLHQDLSESGKIPIEAWNVFAIPKHDLNYSQFRLERSKELGIDRNQLPGSHKI